MSLGLVSQDSNLTFGNAQTTSSMSSPVASPVAVCLVCPANPTMVHVWTFVLQGLCTSPGRGSFSRTLK